VLVVSDAGYGGNQEIALSDRQRWCYGSYIVKYESHLPLKVLWHDNLDIMDRGELP